ncbi:AtzE family amidohydrolase [Acuticoccus sp. I52.16.1]|uniref:AtzE family amidohydrolase n=1 Tax=Acuticoccus sp. I52.16.1 TaxID=2928472 RepID=UPI001FD0227B|nr:AtzE family amidohydrolase [Acuticoccus sp. I52.16.1]UOM33130.1 AtzE family amidohydrolase [Acuticoccus sp. I52.16.1]
MNLAPFTSAAAIARAVRSGETTARAVVEAMLARIAAVDPVVNAYSVVTAERALARADAVDAGPRDGPLAGVPFAVKNLFDLAGHTTLAGAAVTRSDPPATRDADLVEALEAAGAICVGALHMGEFAYDFTGENAHYGPCRNPHDPARMSGGSSSGSGAATAAGIAPVSLGSDTNGSLRVPASLCGVFSLKPTYGRLPRGGTYPFVDSLDHLGPLARTAEDLALAYDALAAASGARDHAFVRRPAAAPAAERRTERIGIMRGWFEDNAAAEANERRDRALTAFPDHVDVALDGAEAGRAAAYLVTNAESAAFHLPRLRAAPDAFDPDTRDRFLAGALLPAAWIDRAQRVRRWWLEAVLRAFAASDVDVMLAPATPFTAPAIGQKTLTLAGREVPLRPNLGLLAQPFSCIGLPVATVPVFGAGELPLGMQLIARPWDEGAVLSAAARLEAAGFTAHPPRIAAPRLSSVA